MKKEYLIIGIALAIAGLWYYNRPKTNYAPKPGQRGYGEGIGDAGTSAEFNTGFGSLPVGNMYK